MDLKYIALVWTSEIGEFAKQCKEYKTPEEIKKVAIVGDNVRVEDLLLLNEIKEIKYDIYKNLGTKTATEIYMLGRCFEQSLPGKECVGLLGYTPLEKETLEFAKNAGVSVSNWKQLKNPIAAKKKTPAKKVAEQSEREPVLKNEKPAEKVKKVRVSKISSNAQTDMIKNLINESGLSKADKQFFTTIENLQAIAEAVKNASDENIGFPFQLQMRFGEKGKIVEPLIKSSYKKLKAEV